jgi:hypothetical protein
MQARSLGIAPALRITLGSQTALLFLLDFSDPTSGDLERISFFWNQHNRSTSKPSETKTVLCKQ